VVILLPTSQLGIAAMMRTAHSIGCDNSQSCLTERRFVSASGDDGDFMGFFLGFNGIQWDLTINK